MFDRFITFFAKLTPQAIAVSSLAGSLTYLEFDATIDRLAGALSEAELPRPGLTAVVIKDPYVHWLFLIALARLGVTTASYLAEMRGQMEPLLKPDFIITDAPEAPGDAERPRLLRATSEWLTAAGRRPAKAMPRVTIDPDSIARIATSSGTTGLPKKFAVSWRSVEESMQQGALLGGAFAITRTLSLIGPEFLPFHGMLTTWCGGGTVLFGPDTPQATAQALTRLQPSSIYMSPVQLKVLLAALPEGFLPLPNLWISVGGSHTPRPVRELTRMRLANNLALIYATTECGLIASRPDTSPGGEDADVGWVSPSAEVEIVDDAHTPLAHGSFGRIRVKGPSVIAGYLDDDEANAKFFHDGWFYPGDVGSLAADGRLRVEGRVDEVMNFGGAKFMPHVIEGAIMACPGVIDVGVFTMPDDAGFDAPWVAIVRDANLREDDVAKALMIPGLPPAHVVWADKIPRTASGKVLRDQLQAAAENRQPSA